MNIPEEKKYDPWSAQSEFYSLSKVFGISSKTNFSISYSKENGLISWLAGPYIILYDLSLDKQISFIKNPNNKIISCLRFNDKGNMLATGEGNCRNGEVRLYQINYNQDLNEVNVKSIVNYKVHKYGIDKILFIRNDEYILSIGNNDDKTIYLYDIQNKKEFFISKFNRPILSCDVSDNFMILCGNKFIKFYDYENYLNKESKEETRDKHLINKSLVDLGKLKDCSFVNVVIDKNDNKIYFITYDGYLAEMKSNKLTLSRWVHLKALKGISLILWNNLLGCGCSDGLFRIFNTELRHICTLKYPPPLGSINSDKEIGYSRNSGYIYADVIASLYNMYHNKLVILYSNKQMISWDISDYSNIKLDISKIFHTGGIKSMDNFQDKENGILKIVTMSDDKTVIYWCIPLNELLNEQNLENMNDNNINKHIFYSKYIRHIFYLGNETNFENFKVKEEEVNKDDDEYNLTTIRFSPCGNYISVGDNFGNIQIFSLENFKLVNKIEVHNGEINSIDMIKDDFIDKIYLSSGSSDNLISLIDLTQGFGVCPLPEEKTEMVKMASPVISVVFCIDKNQQLKLIVGEQNSTITFFLVNNGTLISLQKNFEENLKTYCLSYSPTIRKIISGHNGKISIWKTSTNIAHKHFQVNKGEKLLDNFRVAADNAGLILATSNDDKFIRVRALHDGQLLAKIQVSESISNLCFVLDNNYLIASSIEGYLYFYKLNIDLINKLKKDNLLKNSTEERSIITNKLLLLQKFMESDTSLSNNNQVKNLLKKFQQSEETTIDDLKLLDGFVKEGKKNLNNNSNNINNKKAKEIELKEEKANDLDEQENQNNEQNNNEQNILNKSNMFEKGLRNKLSTVDTLTQKKNFGRVSLTDNYNSKQNFNFKKNIEENNNENNIIQTEKNKKFSNININEDFSNNLNIENISNLNNNITSTTNKEEIKEEIDEAQSEYQPNIIENSKTQLSETHINNLKITRTSNYGIKSFNIRTMKKGYAISKENDIYFEPIEQEEKEKILSMNNVNNIEIINKKDPKEKLIKSIDDNLINKINDENDLKEIEKSVENLLSIIRCKIGKEEKDEFMDKMVDKYSKLILEKINNKIKNNDNNNNNNLNQDKLDDDDLL